MYLRSLLVAMIGSAHAVNMDGVGPTSEPEVLEVGADGVYDASPGTSQESDVLAPGFEEIEKMMTDEKTMARVEQMMGAPIPADVKTAMRDAAHQMADPKMKQQMADEMFAMQAQMEEVARNPQFQAMLNPANMQKMMQSSGMQAMFNPENMQKMMQGMQQGSRSQGAAPFNLDINAIFAQMQGQARSGQRSRAGQRPRAQQFNAEMLNGLFAGLGTPGAQRGQEDGELNMGDMMALMQDPEFQQDRAAMQAVRGFMASAASVEDPTARVRQIRHLLPLVYWMVRSKPSPQMIKTPAASAAAAARHQLMFKPEVVDSAIVFMGGMNDDGSQFSKHLLMLQEAFPQSAIYLITAPEVSDKNFNFKHIQGVNGENFPVTRAYFNIKALHMPSWISEHTKPITHLLNFARVEEWRTPMDTMLNDIRSKHDLDMSAVHLVAASQGGMIAIDSGLRLNVGSVTPVCSLYPFGAKADNVARETTTQVSILYNVNDNMFGEYSKDVAEYTQMKMNELTSAEVTIHKVDQVHAAGQPISPLTLATIAHTLQEVIPSCNRQSQKLMNFFRGAIPTEAAQTSGRMQVERATVPAM